MIRKIDQRIKGYPARDFGDKKGYQPFTFYHLIFEEENEIRMTGYPGSGVLFLSSILLSEFVAWAGPIVMNTREELVKAFEELKIGTFIKDSLDY